VTHEIPRAPDGIPYPPQLMHSPDEYRRRIEEAYARLGFPHLYAATMADKARDDYIAARQKHEADPFGGLRRA
jgi:hypothetical protein